MALQFSQGLLGGLRQFGQGEALPADPNQRNAMQRAGVTNPLLQQFGQSLGGLMGKDMRSEAAIQKTAGSEIVSQAMVEPDPQKQLLLAQQLNKLGYTKEAMALAAKAQAKLQERASRDAMAKQAGALGLTEVAAMLNKNDSTLDLEAAQKQIMEASEKLMLAKRGRKGRIELARKKGKGPEFIKQIQKGDYDGTSDDMFQEILAGKKADLEAFVKPDGTTGMFRVDTEGLIVDDTTGESVPASQLGLTPAPEMTKVISSANELTKALVGKGVDRFDKLVEDAGNAQKTLAAITKSRNLLSKGVNTGVLANLQTGAGKIAALMGLPADDSARTEQLVINQMQFMSDLIRDYGAGTGISNFDVQNVMTRIAADPTLFEETIVDVLNSMEEIAQHVQSKYQVVAEELMKDEELDPSVLNLFKLPERGPALGNTSPNTQGQTLRQKYNLPD